MTEATQHDLLSLSVSYIDDCASLFDCCERRAHNRQKSCGAQSLKSAPVGSFAAAHHCLCSSNRRRRNDCETRRLLRRQNMQLPRRVDERRRSTTCARASRRARHSSTQRQWRRQWQRWGGDDGGGRWVKERRLMAVQSARGCRRTRSLWRS